LGKVSPFAPQTTTQLKMSYQIIKNCQYFLNDENIYNKIGKKKLQQKIKREIDKNQGRPN
jgi:hypothetical protein